MNYLKIDNCNMNNGDGLRCVVWLSACEHHCVGCFNPETWDKNNGDKFGDKQLTAIYDALSQPWCSGITFTGGDPLHPCNIKDVIALCQDIKSRFPTKNIWLYTGYLFEQVEHSIKDSGIDVLIDGEFQIENKSPFAHWVGSSNQRIIDVKKSLDKGEVVLYNKYN